MGGGDGGGSKTEKALPLDSTNIFTALSSLNKKKSSSSSSKNKDKEEAPPPPAKGCRRRKKFSRLG